MLQALAAQFWVINAISGLNNCTPQEETTRLRYTIEFYNCLAEMAYESPLRLTDKTFRLVLFCKRSFIVKFLVMDRL